LKFFFKLHGDIISHLKLKNQVENLSPGNSILAADEYGETRINTARPAAATQKLVFVISAAKKKSVKIRGKRKFKMRITFQPGRFFPGGVLF
jgi:hypothetical protein